MAGTYFMTWGQGCRRRPPHHGPFSLSFGEGKEKFMSGFRNSKHSSYATEDFAFFICPTGQVLYFNLGFKFLVLLLFFALGTEEKFK